MARRMAAQNAAAAAAIGSAVGPVRRIRAPADRTLAANVADQWQVDHPVRNSTCVSPSSADPLTAGSRAGRLRAAIPALRLTTAHRPTADRRERPATADRAAAIAAAVMSARPAADTLLAAEVVDTPPAAGILVVEVVVDTPVEAIAKQVFNELL